MNDQEHMDKVSQLPPAAGGSLLPGGIFAGRVSGGSPNISSDAEIEALRAKGASTTPGTLSKNGSHHLGLTPGFDSANFHSGAMPAGDDDLATRKNSTSQISEQHVPENLDIHSPTPHLARYRS